MLLFPATQISPLILLVAVPLWAKFINFAIFAAVIGGVLYKPISQGLKARTETIKHELQRSNQEKAEVEAKMRELEVRIKTLDQEVTQIKSRAMQDVKAERERILETAQIDADRLKKMAKLEIEGAFKTARLELKSFIATEAVRLAEDILRRNITQTDQSQLVTKYLGYLEKINGNNN